MAQLESAPASILLDPQAKEDKEVYVGLLVRVSLLLVSNDSLEVQRHGDKMRQHLLKFRHKELSSADLLNLLVELVVSPDEDHTSSKSANAKEQNKHRRSLLVLAANNNWRSLDEEETETDGSSHSSSSNKSGSTSVTRNGCSSESSSNDNVSCMGSFQSSFDPQTDCDESELEVQRLMEIDISDDNKTDGDPEGQDDLADIVHPQMLRFYGKSYCHQLKGCLLLAEHNILCEAFVTISCSRNSMHNGVIFCVLNLLNMIWTQREWENTYLHTGLGLSCLFSDCYFLKTVYAVVKFCEDELKRSIGEEITERQSCDTYLASFLHLILPLLLQLLRCIHSLWRDQIACDLSEEIESAKMPINGDESSKQNETGKLLEEIRERGYKVIGLCMSIEGAFADLLDKSSFSAAFVDLESMEFKHLRKLIDAVFLPLVRNCPTEFWKEWMLDILGPLLRHCESILHSAWFSLMHKGRAKVPYYFGQLIGSAENIEKMEHSLLLDFTRAVCRLFGTMSSPESNDVIFVQYFEYSSDRRMAAFQDLESLSSGSLIGFLLAHDCFTRLRMSLFGYWVDDEASRNAIPFCHALVLLGGVIKDQRLKLFVLDDLLPSLIRCIDDQLPCAIRHLICKLKSNISEDVNKDLIMLCRESYNYLSSNVDAESQNIVGEDTDIGSASDNFMHWLAKQKKYLRAKACRAAPNEFAGWKTEWNWEFEDEFRRYLPLYIGMLKEVDAIDASSKDDFSDWDILEKLNPQFRFKYAINSVEHHHFITISNMRRRRYYSMVQVRNHNQRAVFLSKIISIKPYIKGSDSFSSVINRLENIETPFSTFYSYDLEESVRVLLDSVLYFWEPQFHPLIREGHKDLLLWIIDQLTKGEVFEDFQPLIPDPRDFPTYLEPYASLYIMTKLKTSEYATAVLQLRLHQEYDNYLASGELDSYIYEFVSSEENLFRIDVDSCTVPHKFSDLNHGLIALSLKRRTAIVRLYTDALIYSDCIRGLVTDALLSSRLTNLMRELDINGFFAVDNNLVNWEKTTELVDRFRDEVFRGHSLPRHYVIRGIIDYRTILLQKDTWRAFKQVVDEPRVRLGEYLPKFWRDTRHYNHKYYDIVREPLEKIFVESLMPSDHTYC